MAKMMIDDKEVDSIDLQYDDRGIRIDNIDKLFLHVFKGNKQAQKYCQSMLDIEKISLIVKQYNFLCYDRDVMLAAIRRLQKEIDKLRQLGLFKVV